MPHEIHHTKNPLAMYAENPLGVFFDDQEKGEEIVLLLRQHIATQIPPITEIVVIALIPPFVSTFLNITNLGLFKGLSAAQIFFIVVSWYLFAFGFAFYKFIFWYFNVYLVTNERVIDFDFKGILHKETAYAKLNQVQDVTPKMIGFFPTFFHYGDVFIQTASEKPEFEFHRVERPDNVAKVILDQVRLEEGERPGEIA